jgi:hypothetical protein
MGEIPVARSKDWLARRALPLCWFAQKPVGAQHGRENLDFPIDLFHSLGWRESQCMLEALGGWLPTSLHRRLPGGKP